MHDFQITFTHPWLLLLIIPALAVVLIPFFLLSRKYRRNRNRVTSVVLHSCVSLCCVLLLAGMGFSYNVDNSENEILIVMDASYSTDKEKEAKDRYVSDIISMTDPDVYRLGIVSATYFLCGLMDVLAGCIRGLGYSVTPMLVTLVGSCLLRIVWIFTVFQAMHTQQILYISYPLSWLVTAVTHGICYLVLRRRAFREQPSPETA